MNLVRIIAVVIIVLPSSMAVYAGPIYILDHTIGGGGVSGTIETDGAIGTLTSTNILDWNLDIDDGVSTFSLLGPLSGNNSGILISAGTGFTATAINLLFDFGGLTGGILFQSPMIGVGQTFYQITDQINGPGAPIGTERATFRVGREAVPAVDGIDPAKLGHLGHGVPAPRQPVEAWLFLVGLVDHHVRNADVVEPRRRDSPRQRFSVEQCARDYLDQYQGHRRPTRGGPGEYQLAALASDDQNRYQCGRRLTQRGRRGGQDNPGAGRDPADAQQAV